MKLRNKTLLFILIAWSLMFLVVLIGIKTILIDNYLRLESELSVEAVSRVKGAMDQQINAVGETANLWGIWDDAYQYALDKNQDFLNQAVSVASMSAANLDLAIIFDVSAKILFKRYLATDRSKEIAFPLTFLQTVAPGGSLHKFIEKPELNSNMRGLFSADGKVYLIGEHSIVTNAGTGPARGSFMVGKHFTADNWKAIEKTTKMNADFYPLSDIDKSPQAQKNFNELKSSANNVEIKRIDDTHIQAFGLFNDVNNQPIAMMQVNLPRDIYQAGMNSIKRFIEVFFLLGLIFTFLLFYLLRNIIIKPVEKINNEIAIVGETKNFQTRIPITGGDEIAALSNEFNNMFATIAEYDVKNKDYQKDISQKLAQSNILRRSLEKAEMFLTDIINSMPSILLVVDEKMQIIKLNNQAEMEIGLPTKQALGMPLLKEFPYLANHEKKIKAVFNDNLPKTITKINAVNQGESNYYNVLIFPLNKGKIIALRIDNVTALIKLQEQILQNDKLAAIGTLTTGVVNEINEPIDRCFSIVAPLKHNLDSISETITQYAAIPMDANFNTQITAVNAHAERINLPLLLTNSYDLLDSLQNNAGNIASIVKVLQKFSRLDENVTKKTDIHEGIDSTLTLLMPRYKDKINIVKNYANVPPIDCYPGRINQVYMNIIANAFDAIKEKGELIITTALKDEKHVMISFKDNGQGISPDDIQNLFEPFFTTKKTDNATGLGLSIVRTVIHDLQGTIEVKSELGKGTEFIVTLPINVQTE